MCLRRAPEKYIAAAKEPAGAGCTTMSYTYMFFLHLALFTSIYNYLIR
jgi:hypothetical protein